MISAFSKCLGNSGKGVSIRSLVHSPSVLTSIGSCIPLEVSDNRFHTSSVERLIYSEGFLISELLITEVENTEPVKVVKQVKRNIIIIILVLFIFTPI